MTCQLNFVTLCHGMMDASSPPLKALNSSIHGLRYQSTKDEPKIVHSNPADQKFLAYHILKTAFNNVHLLGPRLKKLPEAAMDLSWFNVLEPKENHGGGVQDT